MGEAWGGALLGAYSLGGRLALPFLPVVLGLRSRKGHEDTARLGERRGVASLPRPDRPVLWVHAASVGETNAVLPLVRRLTADGWPVVFTTVTVTGAEIAARTLPDGAMHQYQPLDIRPLVRRFLAHWRPALAVFVESEIWPVTTDELAREGIPHVIVNARVSDRALARWGRLGRAGRRVFGRIGLALAQSDEDAARLRGLGAPRVEVAGNLKFDAPPPAADPPALAAFRERLGGRPVWLAASTHAGEEEIATEVHRRLVQSRPGLVTIIAPRHPERGEEVATMAARDGTQVWLRTRGTNWREGSGILVADTLGELGLFYRAVPVAFVGGSIAPRGGQNPIEPVRLGCAVVHGPRTPNFAAIYAALDVAGGAVTVADADGLTAAVGRLMADGEARRRQTEAAEAALAPFSGALARTLTALAPLLAKAR